MLLTEEKRFVGEQRRHPGKALAQLLAGLHAHRFLAAWIENHIHQPAPVPLYAMHQQAAIGPRHGVDRQQWRMRVTLIQVLHYHGGFVQRQVAIDQRRHAAVGIHLDQLGRLATSLDIDDLGADTLLGEHDAHPMRIVVGGVGVTGQPIGHAHGGPPRLKL
ncbi:hypothetical protein D9M71_644420 [compost metagenome]